MKKMTAALVSLPLVGLALVVSAVGCKNNDAQDPSTIQNNSGGYNQTGGYNNQTGGYPNQTGGYTQPVQTATNPLQIIPCSSDAQCLTARCNMAIGKCSSPCASSADCQTGNGCVAGACVPGVQ